MANYDVIIAGGAAVGSATAYFLKLQPEFSGSVLVVEPDPTYARAASALSASSIRLQFSTPLNVALSQFGMQFLRACGAGRGDVSLVDSTYLFLATEQGAGALRRNAARQAACGVAVRLLDRGALRERYPWINAADLAAASVTDDGEGWFDGYALLRLLRASGERRGVRYLRDTVSAVLPGSGQSVAGVRLANGGTVQCRWFVNAAGTGSRALAASAGVDLPVYPRKRNVFVFKTPVPQPACPMVIDPSGLWFRPERQHFICGVVPDEDPDVAADDFDVQHSLFEQLAWPALAHRVPAFEAVRLSSSWAGHYDYNTFDQNAFLGPCESVPNLLLASGFSGHGLQHAAGVGRSLAEFIVHGAYRSIDLSPLSYARYLRGEPLRESNII